MKRATPLPLRNALSIPRTTGRSSAGSTPRCNPSSNTGERPATSPNSLRVPLPLRYGLWPSRAVELERETLKL